MTRFVAVDRDREERQEWLPNDHLARFVFDVVEQLYLSARANYAGRGSEVHETEWRVFLRSRLGYTHPDRRDQLKHWHQFLLSFQSAS
jgi:hypothetical protein